MKKRVLAFIVVVIVLTTSLLFVGCKGQKTIKIGASATPHAAILQVVKEKLAQEGWSLDIVEYSEYDLPNEHLQNGDLDANYFQHTTFLQDYNEEHGTDLVSAMAVHYEPFGIYAGRAISLAELNSASTVAIPSDATNCARALLLLQEQELITLADDVGLDATLDDIIDEQSLIKKANITLLEANFLSQARVDMSIVMLNGNYALQSGISVKSALAIESATGTAATAYANIIAVKSNKQQNAKTKALIEAMRSQEVLDFIAATYTDGSVQPVFQLD